MKHSYMHYQNHLIADAFANAMGWVSAWVVWWMLLIVVLLLANLGTVGSSPCNGMHAFPLATVFCGFAVFYMLIRALRRGRHVCACCVCVCVLCVLCVACEWVGVCVCAWCVCVCACVVCACL